MERLNVRTMVTQPIRGLSRGSPRIRTLWEITKRNTRLGRGVEFLTLCAYERWGVMILGVLQEIGRESAALGQYLL